LPPTKFETVQRLCEASVSWEAPKRAATPTAEPIAVNDRATSPPTSGSAERRSFGHCFRLETVAEPQLIAGHDKIPRLMCNSVIDFFEPQPIGFRAERSNRDQYNHHANGNAGEHACDTKVT
jgi:hypothetical protein